MFDLENKYERNTNIISNLQRGVNAKDIGVIVDDITKATSNAVAINAYFATEGVASLVFENGVYSIDDTISIKSYNQLLGQNKTQFSLTVTNKDAFELFPFASIENISIILPQNHTECGIKLNESSDFTQNGNTRSYNSYIKNIFIKGYSATGTSASTGLKCNCKDGYNISNFIAEQVTIFSCTYGLYLGAEGTTGWTNGNDFISIYAQNCTYSIYLAPNAANLNTSGNKFVYSVQMGTISRSLVGIYCSGQTNTFIGKLWDQVSGQRLIETAYSSHDNTFIGDYSNIDYMHSEWIVDRGMNNTFLGSNNKTITPGARGGMVSSATDGSLFENPSWSSYCGLADDSLAFADKTATSITVTGGVLASGSWSSVFENSGGINYNNATSATPIVIEMVLPVNYDYSNMIGLNFGSRIPKNVKIEYTASVGGVYTVLRNLTSNNKPTVVGVLSNNKSYGGSVRQIRITLSEAIYNASWNASSLIGIFNMFMFRNGVEGQFYMSRKGGAVYGDLNMTSAYLTVANFASLPTASITYRNKIACVNGGTGVADIYYICVKSISDTYSWKAITTKIDVKDVGLVGNGIANDYTALNTLITAIGSTPTDIYISKGTYKLSSDITIPANVRLIFENGAMLSPDSTKTVTINGEIEAGLYQIFTGVSATPALGQHKIEEIYPEWFGAVAGVESTSAIQKSFNFAVLGDTIKFSSIYNINSELIISKTLNLIGISKYNSGVLNVGTGNAIRVLDDVERGTIRDMRIFGNGVGIGAVGSTTLSGLVFENCYVWHVENCWFRGHGEHGIYFKRGHWTTTINKCEVEYNYLDGINMVGQGYLYTQQINATSVTNCHLAGNGRHGLNMWGNNINILHNIIEGNHNSGIIMSYDYVANATSSICTNIKFNYFELNGDGFINTKSQLSPVNAITSLSISDNYGFMDNANVNAGVTYVCNFVSATSSLSSTSMQSFTYTNNNFYCTGGLKIANFNSILGSTSYITILDANTTQYANFGGATIIHKKMKVIQGYLFAKGLTYADMNLSQAASTPLNVIFPSLLSANELITQLGIWVETDHTAFQLKFQVYIKPYNTNASYTKAIEFTVNGTATGYLTTATVDSIGTIDAKRLLTPNTDCYVNINIVSATGGSSIKLGNLAIQYC